MNQYETNEAQVLANYMQTGNSSAVLNEVSKFIASPDALQILQAANQAASQSHVEWFGHKGNDIYLYSNNGSNPVYAGTLGQAPRIQQRPNEYMYQNQQLDQREIREAQVLSQYLQNGDSDDATNEIKNIIAFPRAVEILSLANRMAGDLSMERLERHDNNIYVRDNRYTDPILAATLPYQPSPYQSTPYQPTPYQQTLPYQPTPYSNLLRQPWAPTSFQGDPSLYTSANPSIYPTGPATDSTIPAINPISPPIDSNNSSIYDPSIYNPSIYNPSGESTTAALLATNPALLGLGVMTAPTYLPNNFYRDQRRDNYYRPPDPGVNAVESLIYGTMGNLMRNQLTGY